MNQKFLFILFIAFLLLGVRYIFFDLYKPHLSDGQEIAFETTVLDEPKTSMRFNRVSVFVSNTFGGEKIFLTYAPSTRLNYGDNVKISGKLEKRVMENKNIIWTMYFPEITHVKTNYNPILSLASNLRQKVKALYYESLTRTDASLLLGIVLGIKGDFPKPFYQELQSSGVLHVIAASGMNVTMVSSFLFSFFGKLFQRKVALGICIAGIIFYAFLSGLQPSIVRATVMGGLAFGAQFFGKQYFGLYGLFVAAFFMLFTNPELIFDIGFQLSVLATLGIILIKPLFPKQKIFDDMGTTISAQIITLPILVGTFGQYGLLSILVNALVLWTIPPLMILGGVGAIVGLVFQEAGKFLLLVTIPLLWFFETTVSYFGSWGWNLQLGSLPLSLILGYYFLLGVGIWMLNKRSKPQDTKVI